MSLTVTCPDCAKMLKIKDEAAGKKVRCPSCSTVFQASAKSNDDDDDFSNGLDEEIPAKKKRRAVEDDLDDDDFPENAARPRKSKNVPKKKSRRKKPGGNNRVVVGAVVGIVSVIALLGLVASIGQINKAVANRVAQSANWNTFVHPLGVTQIDMPGTPTFNAKQSIGGAQTYSLVQRNYLLSLTAIMLPPEAQAALNANPAAAELMFQELETKTPQQVPGASLISSRRIMTGTTQGLEMKMSQQGQVNTMRFYVYPNTLIGAEFITRNEAANSADRERFFNSMRGPDGNLINGPAQVTNVSPTNVSPTNGSANPKATTGPVSSARSLTDARRALQTKLVRREQAGRPVPDPPAEMARTVRYDAPGGKLAAYITTIPQDGGLHPAIVWISGGDCNSIDDGFFKNEPPSNDQTAGAFRKAGVVTMYVSLRGGNDNPGFKESFLGEVDDVLAAADFLSKQQGINPERIYLGGHSTGGTLALLAAESNNHFRAIFSFGPVDDIRGYGDEFIPFDAGNPAELEARNPSKWIDSIQNRTFVLEGTLRPGNIQSLRAMSKASHNANVSFLSVTRANHFSILAPVTKVIADKILQDEGPTTNITLVESELRLRPSR